MKKDITGLDDIKIFVDAFYNRVQQDELIGPVFAGVITDWQPHLEKMYAFWNAALFSVPGFKGTPFAKHAPLPIDATHFDRWLEIFSETIDTHFEGEMAEDAKNRGRLMATVFIARLENLRGTNRITIV
ncbi:MAG: group III truncated hemoglobin [Sphingobacteriaceae bacterium]|nr:MAG: group III truncated hemoglobin [Sphingobacteriaceae bacterium]